MQGLISGRRRGNGAAACSPHGGQHGCQPPAPLPKGSLPLAAVALCGPHGHISGQQNHLCLPCCSIVAICLPAGRPLPCMPGMSAQMCTAQQAAPSLGHIIVQRGLSAGCNEKAVLLQGGVEDSYPARMERFPGPLLPSSSKDVVRHAASFLPESAMLQRVQPCTPSCAAAASRTCLQPASLC